MGENVVPPGVVGCMVALPMVLNGDTDGNHVADGGRDSELV